MNRLKVSSSNLASIGYDSSSNTLQIEFNSGTIYNYSNVPEIIYDELMSASSHGKYFHANIRTDFRCRKIR